jgi:hypothetical protein
MIAPHGRKLTRETIMEIASLTPFAPGGPAYFGFIFDKHTGLAKTRFIVLDVRDAKKSNLFISTFDESMEPSGRRVMDLDDTGRTVIFDSVESWEEADRLYQQLVKESGGAYAN